MFICICPSNAFTQITHVLPCSHHLLLCKHLCQERQGKSGLRELQEVSSLTSRSRQGQHWIQTRLCAGRCWKPQGWRSHSLSGSLSQCLSVPRGEITYVKAEPCRDRSCIYLHSNENVKLIQVSLWFLLDPIRNAFSLIMTPCGSWFFSSLSACFLGSQSSWRCP